MIFELLRKKIKKELDIDLINFERCYVGYWQRSYGAWSWRAKRLNDDNIIDVHDWGSCYSATVLLKEKRPLILYKNEVCIDE